MCNLVFLVRSTGRAKFDPDPRFCYKIIFRPVY